MIAGTNFVHSRMMQSLLGKEISIGACENPLTAAR